MRVVWTKRTAPFGKPWRQGDATEERGVKGRLSRWVVRCAIVTWVASGLLALPGRADVSVERGSSIIIFPKVISDNDGLLTRGFPVETIIQISNTSNSLAFAHCFYVNAAPLDPSQPPGPFNPPQWQEVDFDLVLTKQQPTYWVVGQGRRVDPTDPQCSRVPPVFSCPSAGFDPGAIPAVPPNFQGQLVCIEVDSAGAPLNGNRLKGEATLVTPRSTTVNGVTMRQGEVSKYNAIGIAGLNTDTNSNDGDLTLCIGGNPRPGCPAGAEYNGCPDTVIVNHFGERATMPALPANDIPNSRVETEVTLVPCTQDFENQVPGSVVVQFRVTNEFENLFSASTTVTCWSNFRLAEVGRIFDASFLGTRFAQTRMTPGGIEQPGFLGVSEEFYNDGRGVLSRAALNLHVEGVRPGGDVITIPEVAP